MSVKLSFRTTRFDLTKALTEFIRRKVRKPKQQKQKKPNSVKSKRREDR